MVLIYCCCMCIVIFGYFLPAKPSAHSKIALFFPLECLWEEA